jgi:hypothetical protein
VDVIYMAETGLSINPTLGCMENMPFARRACPGQLHVKTGCSGLRVALNGKRLLGCLHGRPSFDIDFPSNSEVGHVCILSSVATQGHSPNKLPHFDGRPYEKDKLEQQGFRDVQGVLNRGTDLC